MRASTSSDDTDPGNDDARTEDLVDTAAPAGPPVVESAPSTGEVRISGPGSGSFELALFYVQSGQHLKALEIYEDLLENNPMDASVHNNIGIIHLNTSNNAEAIQSFNNAILIDANYDTAHNNLGDALRRDGRDGEAERMFKRALEINPRNADAMTNLANLYSNAGRIEEAKFQYLQALRLNPASAIGRCQQE